MFKVNNEDTKTTQILKRNWRRFGVFIVNFEHISHLCSSVSIVNFEHVTAGWDVIKTSKNWANLHFKPQFHSFLNKGNGKIFLNKISF